MAYGTDEVLQAMEGDSGIPTLELRVDGGVAQNEWLMEFQAGILGVPVRRPAVVETTALGAAGLAGLHLGVWKDGEEFLAAQGPSRVFEPRMADDERERLRQGWASAVRAARAFTDGG
jgi:glycerol kinase